jgi:hypothetical protein
MGTIPQDGQWSISGGTGELTMARGIVNHKVIEETSISVVYEVEVHAYYIPVNSMVSMMEISLCIWSLWGWFFSASWTAFRAVRTTSWEQLGQQDLDCF